MLLNFDVIVLGAGLYGISAAKTYLDVHPGCKLAVLEADTAPGGVWSQNRAYDGFLTQTGLRHAEFSDMPLKLPPNAPTYHDHFEAKHVTSYIEKYVDRSLHDGRSLRSFMKLGITVTEVEKKEGKWNVHGRSAGQESHHFQAPKLIVATGLTSEPNMPSIPNLDQFEGMVIHQKYFGRSPFLASPTVQNVAVIGGAKSAADMVYLSVKAGKSVSWIIRETGNGPGAFASPAGKGRYRNSNEKSSTRLASTWSPSPYLPVNFWTRFLHRTYLGRWVTKKHWGGDDARYRKEVNYHGRPGAREDFALLDPNAQAFWYMGNTGHRQRDDFWDTIAQQVHVFRDHILSVEGKKLHLASGIELEADVILCGTGWNPSHKFFRPEQLVDLGLPYDINLQSPTDANRWADLTATADRRVLEQFPLLSHSPMTANKKPTKTTPYRLYNGIATPNDPSIAFVGHIQIANSFRAAECQALWAVAYLDQELTLPSEADMLKDIAFVNAWSSRRYPTNGQQGNFYEYELVGYTDKLLRDVGISSHLQKGCLGNLRKPCQASDLRQIRAEYVQLRRGRAQGAKDSIRSEPPPSTSKDMDGRISVHEISAES